MRRWAFQSAGWLALGAGSLMLAGFGSTAIAAAGDSLAFQRFSAGSGLAAFTPASFDPRVAELVARTGNGRMIRFTPAGASSVGVNRAVTVAVRVDADMALAISQNSAISAARNAATSESPVRIAPTRYNLGLARGYSSFAQAPAPSAIISRNLTDADIPDLATYRPSAGVAEEPSRFGARIAVEQGPLAEAEAAPARSATDRMVDVGGSYRITRNLDVTAGVRVEQDRDLRALPDVETQDSRAVYIGTQFRF